MICYSCECQISENVLNKKNVTSKKSFINVPVRVVWFHLPPLSPDCFWTLPPPGEILFLQHSFSLTAGLHLREEGGINQLFTQLISVSQLLISRNNFRLTLIKLKLISLFAMQMPSYSLSSHLSTTIKLFS